MKHASIYNDTKLEIKWIDSEDITEKTAGTLLKGADGIILASPSYYGSCSAQLKMFLERAGFACRFAKAPLKGKVGAALAIQERDGGLTVYSELVNWMLSNQMVVVGSTPLTVLTGKNPFDYEKDERGMKALRILAHNMAEELLKG